MLRPRDDMSIEAKGCSRVRITQHLAHDGNRRTLAEGEAGGDMAEIMETKSPVKASVSQQRTRLRPSHIILIQRRARSFIEDQVQVVRPSRA